MQQRLERSSLTTPMQSELTCVSCFVAFPSKITLICVTFCVLHYFVFFVFRSEKQYGECVYNYLKNNKTYARSVMHVVILYDNNICSLTLVYWSVLFIYS